MDNSETNKLLELLYSTKFVNFYCVYECLFELRDSIAKKPEIREIIQGLAKEKEIDFEYDIAFYFRLLYNWMNDYKESDVLQAIQISVPSKFYKNILDFEYHYGIPNELTKFLLLHEIEKSEQSVISVDYRNFSWMSLDILENLKKIADSYNKTIKVKITPFSLNLYYDVKIKVMNHSLFVFDFMPKGFEDSDAKAPIYEWINSYVHIYNEYERTSNKKKSYDEHFICKIYPYFLCAPKLFYKELNKKDSKKDSRALLLEHLEKLQSEIGKHP